jgi:hypothetical protein
VELAGGNGMNDYGSGTIQTVTAEEVGPVSAKLRVDLTNPQRTVWITLYAGVDRVDVANAITENETGFQTYSFHVGTDLSGAQIRFEEIGAIAKPGMVADEGDFLQGTRASRMTLNHFVSFALADYHLVLSNWDAYAMQVNDSTNSTFDLTGDEVHVVVMEQGSGAGTSNQGGDDYFLNRFALRGMEGTFDGAEDMRTALAHQNPLHAIALPRSQNGLLTDASAGMLSIDSDDVVVTAFKPAEDDGAGFVVRLWELAGSAASFTIDASAMIPMRAWRTSLIETDRSLVSVSRGFISSAIDANEIRTFRFADTTYPPRVRAGARRLER